MAPGEPAQNCVSVLLASNRPSVHAFIAELGRYSTPPLSVMPLPLRCGAVDEHRREVELASVAMIDVGSDPDDGVRVSAALRAARPDLRILVVVCCPKPTRVWHVQQFLAADVNGILDAEVAPMDLIAALGGHQNGSAARLQLNRLADSLSTDLEGLSGADRELLTVVARGLSDAEIGVRLSLSERSVRNRLERIRNVLSIERRTELAAWAGAHGLYAPAAASG